jgi:hypothetical protein
VQETCSCLSDLAEPLDGDAGTFKWESTAASRVFDGVDDALARASARPTEPPIAVGLPVTTPGTEKPRCIDTVSMIQAIVWALVPTSGAGMSESGPMMPSSSVAKRRVSASSSVELIEPGSHVTPPFAPPNGTSTSAHFQVIHIASARTSSMSVLGWKRNPPLAGPRATLCWTR